MHDTCVIHKGVVSRGAPTGKWPSLPAALQQEGKIDILRSKVRLIVRRPNVPEVEIPIEKSEFLIGRMASVVDLALDDDLVSRKHARLTINERGYFKLEDLGSKNGIQYSGRPVRRLNLMDGDEFSIGKTTFVFHAEVERFRALPKAPAPAPRADSAFMDIDVPQPSAEELSDDAPVGWDPKAAKPPPDPAEPAGAPRTPRTTRSEVANKRRASWVEAVRIAC